MSLNKMDRIASWWMAKFRIKEHQYAGKVL